MQLNRRVPVIKRHLKHHKGSSNGGFLPSRVSRNVSRPSLEADLKCGRKIRIPAPGRSYPSDCSCRPSRLGESPNSQQVNGPGRIVAGRSHRYAVTPVKQSVVGRAGPPGHRGRSASAGHSVAGRYSAPITCLSGECVKGCLLGSFQKLRENQARKPPRQSVPKLPLQRAAGKVPDEGPTGVTSHQQLMGRCGEEDTTPYNLTAFLFMDSFLLFLAFCFQK